MKKWIGIGIGIVALGLIAYVIWNENRPVYFSKDMKVVEEPKIEPNAWQPYKFIDPTDSLHVYRVTWSQKYGETKTAYCNASFRNDKEKQYKLVAPWMSDVEIERANMDDIQFDKISKDSVPEGALKQK